MPTRETSLTVIHFSHGDLAARYGAVPDTPWIVDPLQRGGGPSNGALPLNRWWSREFRTELYQSIPAFVKPPTAELIVARGWDAENFCRAAGVGLISFIREQLGFALDIVDVIREGNFPHIVFVTNNRRGMAFGQILNDAAHLMGTRASVRYVSRFTGWKAIPVAGPLLAALVRAESVARTARSLGATRFVPTQRVPVIDSLASRTDFNRSVAFFEANWAGWAHAVPLMQGLESRGIHTTALVRSRSDGQRVRQAVGRYPYMVLPRRVAPSFRASIHGAINSMPILLHDDDQRSRNAKETLVRSIIKQRLDAHLASMNGAVSAARQVTESLGVKVTYQLGNVWPTSRVFMLEAQARGAHTFTTPHGLIDATEPENDYAVRPDTLLAWGAQSSGLVPLRGTKIVGNWLFESRLRQVEEAIATRTAQEPLVLVAFGRPGRIVSPGFFASAIRLIVATAARHKEYRFVVNLHPGDKREFWRAALDGIREPLPFEMVSGRIYELLGRCMALVTMHSTAGGEAMVLGIPVICVVDKANSRESVRSAEFQAEYVKQGAAYSVADPAELGEVLAHLRGSPEGSDRLAIRRQSYASRFLARTVGMDGVKRTVRAIEEQLSGR